MDKLAESDVWKSSLRMLNEKIDRRAAHMIKPTVSKSSFAIFREVDANGCSSRSSDSFALTWILREGSTSDITQLYVTNRSNLVKVLYLPDGTKVWLNKNTSLIYPEKFSTKQREVILDGEAFFDVTKDKKHPFVVKTSSFNIKVLGTTFNVHSYKEDVQVSAVLESGVIQLQSAQGDALVTMHPGQQALYKPDTKELEVSYVAVNEHTSWRYNLVTLNNVTIHEVVKAWKKITR
jgi:ferric-dicitrate binding protein FerR (iron transport regulator)